jgi:carbamoyltransferase
MKNKDIFILGYTGTSAACSVELTDKKSRPSDHTAPLSFLGHDATAALIKNGEIIAIAEEERLTRIKHISSFPKNAIQYCLDEANVSIDQIDHFSYYLDFNLEIIKQRLLDLAPNLSIDQIIATGEKYIEDYYSYYSHDKLIDEFEKNMNYKINREVFHFIPHHLAHAASVFYTSGFDKAIIISADAYGDLFSQMCCLGDKEKITPIMHFPLSASLGWNYSIHTVFLGFHSYGDEYKVMGLSSYGDPSVYIEKVRSLAEKTSDGFWNYPYIAYNNRERTKFLMKQWGQFRNPDQQIEDKHKNIAASIQLDLEEKFENLLNFLTHKYPEYKNLCIAGGTALNAKNNGRILKFGKFENIEVHPAAGDSGCALGSSLYTYHQILGFNRKYSRMNHVYYGPSYTSDEIEKSINSYSKYVKYVKVDDISARTAQLLSKDNIIGWFQGRMEYGPRALGNRSILANPSKDEMMDRVNISIKKRESFRPFAPSVLIEYASEYFELYGKSDFYHMLFIVPVKKDKQHFIPAITHIDGTARIHTVDKNINYLYWNLINEFMKISGIPVLLNTSFNVKGEPIVCSPEDAIKCFLNTDMNYLVIHDYLIEKI